MIQINHPDGRTLHIDSTTSMKVAESAAVAMHPIESGSPASDHAETGPISLTLTCTLTENPTTPQEDRTVLSTAQNLGGLTLSRIDVLAGLSGPGRIRAAQVFLRDCVGEYLSVISGRFLYGNCLLTAWPSEWSIKRAHPFNLSFVIPRQVILETVRIPPRKAVPATLVKEEDAGASGTSPLTGYDKSLAQLGLESTQNLLGLGN